MADTVTFEMRGLTDLIARFDSADAAAKTRIRAAMGSITEMLVAQSQENVRTIFRRNTGRLAASISGHVEQSGDVTTGTVTSAGTPYAHIQEYGGTTKPHPIYPVNAQALRFLSPGGPLPIGKTAAQGVVFAKHVNHPGSRIPERSFLRRALAQRRTDIEAMLREAATGAFRDMGFKLAAD